MSNHTSLPIGLGALVILGCGAIGHIPGPARAADPVGNHLAEKQTEKVEFASAELAVLEVFVGPWRVTETHFNARGEPIATVKGTEEIGWILDHHAIRRTYKTKTEKTAFEAVGTLTYNEADKAYRGVWFDSVSTTGPTEVRGTWDKESRTFVFTFEAAVKDGSTVHYKVIETFPDEERRVATTYLLKGDEVIKRLEVQYKRYVPCPTAIRHIFGG